jgi:hypothetical protein
VRMWSTSYSITASSREREGVDGLVLLGVLKGCEPGVSRVRPDNVNLAASRQVRGELPDVTTVLDRNRFTGVAKTRC